jgi:DNA-binding beta-propeller fold protein YncE
VTSSTLVAIGVTPAAPSIAKGTTQQFMATGVYSDNSTQNLTSVVTWHAVNPAVASIGNAGGNAGLATALTAGTTQITATLGGVVGSTNLKVTAAILVSIAVAPPNLSIAKGTVQQLTATGTYSDNSTQDLTSLVTWAPTASAVATVSIAAGSEGLASALTPGTITVTATLGTIVGTTGLTVTAATLVSIDVTPITATIRIGATQQYTATGHYTDLTTQDITTLVTWNSGTAATATISNAAGTNGLATGLAQGTTLVTAALGAINSNANPATLTVAAFAYAVNFLSNNVSQFLIGTDGTLTAIGAGTVAAGANPYALAVDPSSNFVYVANFLQPGTVATTISQFAIGADGSLTGIGTGSVAAAGHGPNGITVSPTGPYVYTANFGTNDVSLYSIGAGGALTFVASVAAGAGPAAIALNPAGTFAYVANFLDGDVSQYSVSAADGSLTPLGTVPAGSQSNMVVVDPSGRFVYVPNHAAGTVSQYVIGAGGALTPIAAAVASGTGAWSITIDSAGSNAYVANADANSVSHFTIDPASGALTLVNALGLPALIGPTSVAIDPSGLFAYISDRGPVASPQTTISQCSIAADGSLTLLTPPIAPAGTAPAAIITAR